MLNIADYYYIVSAASAFITLLCIAAAYRLHTSKKLSWARLYRPNHTYECTSDRPVVHFYDDEENESNNNDEVSSVTSDTVGQLDQQRVSSLFSLPPFRRLLCVGEEDWETNEEKVFLQAPHGIYALAILKMAAVCFLICPLLSSCWSTLLVYLCEDLQNANYQSIDTIVCPMLNASQCELFNTNCNWTSTGTCEASGLQFSFDMLTSTNMPWTSDLRYGVEGLAKLHALLCAAVIIKMMFSLSAHRRRLLKQELEQHSFEYRTVKVKGLQIKKDTNPTTFITRLRYLSSNTTFPAKFAEIDPLLDEMDPANSGEVLLTRKVADDFKKRYLEYVEALDSLKEAHVLERRYHEDLMAQRQVAYKLLDEGTVRDVDGAEVVAYQKETDLPSLEHCSINTFFCYTPLVAHREKELRLKATALNNAIQEGQSKDYNEHALIVFKDALSAHEFIDRFNKAYCSIFDPFDQLSASLCDLPHPEDLPSERPNLSTYVVLLFMLVFIVVGYVIILKGSDSVLQWEDFRLLFDLFNWYTCVPVFALCMLSPWLASIRISRLFSLGDWTSQKKYDATFSQSTLYSEEAALPFFWLFGVICAYFAPLLQLLVGLYALNSYVVGRGIILDGHEPRKRMYKQRPVYWLFWYLPMLVSLLGIIYLLITFTIYRGHPYPFVPTIGTVVVHIVTTVTGITLDFRNRVTLGRVKELMGTATQAIPAVQNSSHRQILESEVVYPDVFVTAPPAPDEGIDGMPQHPNEIDDQIVKLDIPAPVDHNKPPTSILEAVSSAVDTEKLVKGLREAKPYLELHELLTSRVDVNRDIALAATHTVRMTWHGEDEQKLMRDKRQATNEVKGRKLANSIARKKN